MLVRSLSTAVLAWPDVEVVDAAVRGWGEELRRVDPNVVAVGYFGTYARGD